MSGANDAISDTAGPPIIEPELEKIRVMEILQSDPWNKEALLSMSKIEFGDKSRLYRIDAVRSDVNDLDLVRDFVIWEINEESMGSKKTEISRLSIRIEKVVKLISEESGHDLEEISGFLGKSIVFLNENRKTKEVILGLKAMMLLEKNYPKIMSKLLSMKLACTKAVVTELMKGRGGFSSELFHQLLIAISENSYLFTDLEIRRGVTKKIFEMGDFDLAFWLAMKCVEINPQDHSSALVGLEAAICIGDDDKTLLAGGILLSMKKEPAGIKYGKIAASAIRKNRVGYAQDLLKRRRMKLDLDGHKKRLGICFQEKDWKRVLDELERTPKPFSEHDSLRSYKTLALTEKNEVDRALRSIGEIDDNLEKDLLTYNLKHTTGDYNGAMWALNNHLSKNGMAIIDEVWGDSGCSFLEISSSNFTSPSKNHGKVSVIMTCHRFNDALPLALKSIANQNYPNIQFIFVDDYSPEEDIPIYDKLLEGMNATRIRMDENSGTYAGRNSGLEVADGDFITFADSDDWVHPEKISNSIEIIKRTNSDLVVGRYIRMRENGSIQWNGIRFARFALMGMTFKSSIIKEILRGFDSRMRHSSDSELFERARVLLGEKKVRRYPTIEIIALESGSNLTSEGSLAIDWVGTSGDRVRYAEEYRKWHRSLKGNRQPREIKFSSIVAGEISEDIQELRDSFGYEMPSESIAKRSSMEELGRKLDDSREDILVTMCTYPGGFSTVNEAVSSLLFEQTLPISRLKLTINGGEMPEELPDDSRLEVILSKEDVTDRGKFIQIGNHNGFVITADDDIKYPSDYVETMVGHVEEFGRQSLIGVHGAHIPEGPPITRWWEYMNFRRSIVFHQEIPEYMPVNVIGTGTLAFHTCIGVPDPDNFDYQRMVDLHLAVWAQRRGVPMTICPRRRDWLQEINSGYVGRIWDSAKEDSILQHKMLEVLQRSKRWTMYAEREWGEFSNSGITLEFGIWDNRELCPGIEIPSISNGWEMASENPLVTIYMPAFNCEDYIIDSIESALNQTYKNIEVCVHDDGSTDNTLKVIKRKYRFNGMVKISTGPNSGIGFASNASIKNGKGELILQLDSDDIIHPEALESLVPMMEDGAVCAYGSFIRVDTSEKKIDDGWDWPIFSRPRLLRSMIVHHPRLFRRDAWESIGGFDEELENAVDYDFFLRLSEIGEMEHLSRKLYSYRIHQASTSQDRTDIQTRNTYIVQRLALERMGLEDFTNFAPNPEFPRRIHYTYSAFLNREIGK